MKGFYENGLKGHVKIAQGVEGVKPPALPWATLLRPIRGLETIFICGGEPEKVMGHFHENEFGVHALTCLKQGQPKG